MRASVCVVALAVYTTICRRRAEMKYSQNTHIKHTQWHGPKDGEKKKKTKKKFAYKQKSREESKPNQNLIHDPWLQAEAVPKKAEKKTKTHQIRDIFWFWISVLELSFGVFGLSAFRHGDTK